MYFNNSRSSLKSKHIDIKFLVVKERVQSGQVFIEHIGTNSMIAYLHELHEFRMVKFLSHCMQFPCYTSMLDLCHLVILIYVIIDEFSYDINVMKIALILY